MAAYTATTAIFGKSGIMTFKLVQQTPRSYHDFRRKKIVAMQNFGNPYHKKTSRNQARQLEREVCVICPRL
jgi:hypothetical protein